MLEPRINMKSLFLMLHTIRIWVLYIICKENILAYGQPKILCGVPVGLIGCITLRRQRQDVMSCKNNLEEKEEEP